MNVDEFQPLTKTAIRTLLEARQSGKEVLNEQDKRRLPRWPFPGKAELWLVKQDGSEPLVIGEIHELNEMGAGIRCGLRIEPGQVVTIAIHQPEASFHGTAVVRHCTAYSTGYQVGLEFECD